MRGDFCAREWDRMEVRQGWVGTEKKLDVDGLEWKSSLLGLVVMSWISVPVQVSGSRSVFTVNLRNRPTYNSNDCSSCYSWHSTRRPGIQQILSNRCNLADVSRISVVTPSCLINSRTRSSATAEGPRDAQYVSKFVLYFKVKYGARIFFQTAKVTSKVIQRHWQWCHSIGHIRFPIRFTLQLCLHLAPFPWYYHLFPKT